MLKKIVSTIFSRTILAGLNFLLAILTTQYLGPEGKGDVSLFVLNLTIVQILNNFVGGPYLVYLIPRNNTVVLLVISYLWAVFTSAAIPVLLFLFNLLNYEYVVPLSIISFLFSANSINTMVLTGKEEINKFNITALIQVLVLIVAFIVYVNIFGIRNLSSYVNAMYFSTGCALIVSIGFIAKYIQPFLWNTILKTFFETIRSGFVIQIANVAQMFSYRLSFYFLYHLHNGSTREVGIYSVAVSIAEALWLISHSFSLVLYSRISNINDYHQAKRLTMTLVTIVFLLTSVCATFLLCLPPSFFAFIFGEGFASVKNAIFPMSLGIIFLSAGILFSSFFVGIGKPNTSVIGALIGLFVTIIFGVFLIPRYGIMGAGVTASASYVSGTSYQFYVFMKDSKEYSIKDFILKKSDLRIVISEFRNSFLKK